MSDILIIDDDPGINALLCKLVARMGNRPHPADTARKGLEAIEQKPFDVVLLDVGLPDGNGMNLLPRIRRTKQPPEIIILTGNGDPDAAESAIKDGAWDYLVKPAALDDIQLKIEKALGYRRKKTISAGAARFKRQAIVGSSPAFTAVLERAAMAAASTANVLIGGETGTGKELLARAIHDNSDRARQPYVVVDCAALPPTLVESVLFGYVKGAFTGAQMDRHGLVRQADGGTLVLDEVGELPLAVQKKLLRVIQERRFRPVSGSREITADFRLIAATNRDLDSMVAKGQFREDLLFRLRAFSIDLPALRQRAGDIKLLVRHHLSALARRHGSTAKMTPLEFLEALVRYPWPGNVRELFHALEEAFCSADGEPELHIQHLPIHVRAHLIRMSVSAAVEPITTPTAQWPEMDAGGWPRWESYRHDLERHYLTRLLMTAAGSRKEACRLSGLSRTRLFELIRKHQLADAHWPTSSNCGQLSHCP